MREQKVIRNPLPNRSNNYTQAKRAKGSHFVNPGRTLRSSNRNWAYARDRVLSVRLKIRRIDTT